MKEIKIELLGIATILLGIVLRANSFFEYSSLLCMGMSIYSGHKLVSPMKKKITKPNNSENS